MQSILICMHAKVCKDILFVWSITQFIELLVEWIKFEVQNEIWKWQHYFFPRISEVFGFENITNVLA